MKLVIITDTHFGCRSDNTNLLDHQKIFYNDVFFPYLKKNNITTVCHLGDIVDRRKYINFNTLDRMHKDFLKPLSESTEEVVMISGNHDVYYKNNNNLNSIDNLIRGQSDYKNFKIHTTLPIEYTFKDKTQALLLPWICQDNEKESMEAIKKSKSPICMAHLQLIGFEMHKGSFAEEGLTKETFDKFSTVLTGHFHHKSDYDNIHYLGCPYQMNWGDYADTKGFHVFDTVSQELTFIPNPYSLFHKIEYDDKNIDLEGIMSLDFSKYKKSFIRIVVKNKNNPYWFDMFSEKIEQEEPLSIQVIEDMGNLAFDGEETDLIHVEDTITLLSNYCNQIGVNENIKPKLNELLQSLYNEANNQRIS